MLCTLHTDWLTNPSPNLKNYRSPDECLHNLLLATEASLRYLENNDTVTSMKSK